MDDTSHESRHLDVARCYDQQMLRRLAHVAHPFNQADSVVEVLDTLQTVADPTRLKVHVIGRMVSPGASKQTREKAKGFLSGVETDLQADWRNEFIRRGPSLLTRYAATNPPPFTLLEAQRRLQPSGDDRWLFDLFRDHRVKDSLWCAYGPWLVAYLSDRPLTRATLPDETRAALDAASAMAVRRINELALITEGPPSLSPRQKTILLHLSDGLTVPEIAARLKVSETSVKTFVARAARKLGAKSQLHAVAIALRERLI